MVCDECEKKLRSVICPDPWRAGAKNVKSGAQGRKINEIKINRVEGKSNKSKDPKCKKCYTRLLNKDYKYCIKCGYKAGICTMCGKKILDTSMYKMSNK